MTDFAPLNRFFVRHPTFLSDLYPLTFFSQFYPLWHVFPLDFEDHPTYFRHFLLPVIFNGVALSKQFSTNIHWKKSWEFLLAKWQNIFQCFFQVYFIHQQSSWTKYESAILIPLMGSVLNIGIKKLWIRKIYNIDGRTPLKINIF